MKKNKLKLFVWYPALSDYTDGIIFAYAESVEAARSMILEKNAYASVEADITRNPGVYDNEPVHFVIWGGG